MFSRPCWLRFPFCAGKAPVQAHGRGSQSCGPKGIQDIQKPGHVLPVAHRGREEVQRPLYSGHHTHWEEWCEAHTNGVP